MRSISIEKRHNTSLRNMRNRLTIDVSFVFGAIGLIRVQTDDKIAMQFVYDALVDFAQAYNSEEAQLAAVTCTQTATRHYRFD